MARRGLKRNKHNLSHYHLLTCDMGQLIPIGCVPALPGDTFQHYSNVLTRVSPMVAPIMHPVTARVHHFFVPYRKLWEGADGDNWEDFITGGPDGDNAATPPKITTTGDENDLLNYLGLPPVADIEVNAFPVRAFNAIYNEYYRDQDLVEERDLDDLTIPQVAWEKDYFTSARPWTQKGPDVTVPIGEWAPVRGIGKESDTYVDSPVTARETNGIIREYASRTIVGGGGANDEHYFEEDPTQPGFPNIWADLSQAIGGNINDVRRAFAIQRYQEARARYGSRYTEYLRYLGVTPSDARLQRPEFLGGGRAQINISEVLQTGPEADPGPGEEFGVGDMYGHGISAMRSNKYRRFIEEHGVIMSMLSVRPKTMYLDGIHREWLRNDKEDYFQKELQHIGQQEVLNNEVFADAAAGSETFGYQDRYMEYRQHPSYVSSEFRNVLDFWHMGRDFESPPVLNQSFTDCVPTKRIHQEQTMHALWIMVQHKIVARRLVDRSATARIF